LRNRINEAKQSLPKESMFSSTPGQESRSRK
jgi:hypothetical protein